MVESIARITLDVQDLSTSVTVSAKHGDTGRKIVIALSDGGFLYEVGPDCYAVLTAEKPDGSILFNHCDIEGNCIVYAFTEQTTAVVGVFPCEVKLYGADDALITTARFRIIVDGTVYNDGRVESKDEISALTHLISQVSEAKENAEQAAEDGAAAVQSSLLALENADEAIRTANTAANNANLAAEEANKYLPVATEALQTAGAAVQTANEAKQGVNTLREVVSKFHSNIVETATGEVIQLSDASDLELAGLRIFGKTTQNGAPTPATPVPLESIGESVNVTLEGTDTQPQALTVTTPDGLPGIPVTSGGNYIDPVTGKHWICDEVDFEKGVYIQRVRMVSVSQTTSTSDSLMILPDTAGAKRPLSIISNYADGAKFGLSDSGENIFIRGSANASANKVNLTHAELNALLTETPMVLIYALAKENHISLSEIAPDALAQYATLHTNYPNTTVYNDARAHMEVRYIADTQKYVDKKFEALEAAIANLI